MQIINRVSSGYPVWYIWVAVALHQDGELNLASTSKVMKMLGEKSEWIVRGMVVYAVVQGGLYASFMPPA